MTQYHQILCFVFEKLNNLLKKYAGVWMYETFLNVGKLHYPGIPEEWYMLNGEHLFITAHTIFIS